MKVHLNATSWKYSKETELVTETEGAVKFLNDHGVPFEKYHSPKSEHFSAVEQLEWHESVSIVDIPCDTVQELQEYCNKYDAVFEVHANYVKISFQ